MIKTLLFTSFLLLTSTASADSRISFDIGIVSSDGYFNLGYSEYNRWSIPYSQRHEYYEWRRYERNRRWELERARERRYWQRHYSTGRNCPPRPRHDPYRHLCIPNRHRH